VRSKASSPPDSTMTVQSPNRAAKRGKNTISNMFDLLFKTFASLVKSL
jgi:hypothetical protein